MTKIEIYKISFKICAAVVFCLLQTQLIAFADSPINLALHRKLDYDPKPEYQLTIHPRDQFKLTDGIKDRSLWYEKYREKTVGWYMAPLIEIKIDLEQVKNVGYINIYTVGGGQNGIEYPEYVAAAVGLDHINYNLSSYSTSVGWVFGTTQAIPRTIVLPVEQKARYIKLFVRPAGYSFFSDEIEVIEAQNATRDISTGDFLSKTQMIDLVERARQLERERDVLYEKVEKSAQLADASGGDWQAMKEQIALLGRNPTESRISKTETAFALFRAKWLQSEYRTEWLCLPAEPLEILRQSDLPKSVPNDFAISLYQWKNEHGIATVNLTNCSQAPINFCVNFSPLRLQDKTLESKGIFELRRALYVRVINAGLVADPLVLQNTKSFPVAPGQTVQLWIDAYSKGLDAGVYTAAMGIEASGENIAKTQQTIPIQLEIAGRTFPETLPGYYCNWDYVTISDRFTSKTSEQVKQAVRDLENHYINVVTIRLDALFDGHKSTLSLQKLSNELALRSGEKPFVLLALGGQNQLESRFGSLRTDKGKSNFRSLLTQLRNAMVSNGYNYESFALYPFDEYIGEDFIYAARVIRDFDPKLNIYANKWFESDSQFRQVKDLINIWCPYISDIVANRSKFEYYKDHGAFEQIWCYNTILSSKYVFGPAYLQRAIGWDGKISWRFLPIVADYFKLNGAGFWVYQDANMSGWNKDTFRNYGVIYDGLQNPDKNCIPELILPSKRWQQWREGIEDAVCLSGHQELLEEFFSMPNSKLNSEYLYSLRRRADKELQGSK